MSRHFGETAETLAANYLHTQGLQLIERNFQGRYGEIDLIMQTTSHLVFVEVRYRRDSSFGNPIETVTPSKQRKLFYTAQYYLQKNPIFQQMDYRFDIVAITFSLDQPQIEWISNAFGEQA